MRDETFQTPGPVRAEVRIGAGEIRFEAAETAETTVSLRPLRDNDSTREAVEEARVELREYGGRYEVLVEVRDGGRRGFSFGRGAEVRVELRCPEGTEIEARTGSADIEGRGRFGSVDAETGSGDVHFDEVTGDARVSAASGDIAVSKVGGEARINTASGDIQLSTVAGAAKLNSASGDVMIREAGESVDVNSASGDVFVGEVASSVTVNTASGDQEIQRAGQGKVTLKSASGDLEIGIPEGSTLWVDARSRSGEVRSELPVSESKPEGEGPHIELRANTMSGDITVTRA
jgi:DUF4097 and DUF4098 domain-containing protein YvlB